MSYLTTSFYLLGGTLCTAASIFSFYSYLKVKQRANLSLAFVFFWIGFHAYAFAFPTVVNPSDLKLLAFGYIIGVGMIFLVLLSGLEVQFFMTKHILLKSLITLSSFAITGIAILTLSIMLYDIRTPIINPSGLIFWNIDPLAAWLIGLTSFTYGCTWSYVFYRGALLVQDGYARFKLLAISVAGILIGTIALLVHTSSNEFQTVIGHALFIIAGIVILSIYLIPEKLFKIEEHSHFHTL